MAEFVADTYAMVELARGQPSYRPFLEDDLHTTYLHLYELYHIFHRGRGEAAAREVYETYRSRALVLRPDWIFAGSELRLRFKKRRLSYVDTLGYAAAVDLQMPLLTGDEGFRGLPGVRFVK